MLEFAGFHARLCCGLLAQIRVYHARLNEQRTSASSDAWLGAAVARLLTVSMCGFQVLANQACPTSSVGTRPEFPQQPCRIALRVELHFELIGHHFVDFAEPSHTAHAELDCIKSRPPQTVHHHRPPRGGPDNEFPRG